MNQWDTTLRRAGCLDGSTRGKVDGLTSALPAALERGSLKKTWSTFTRTLPTKNKAHKNPSLFLFLPSHFFLFLVIPAAVLALALYLHAILVGAAPTERLLVAHVLAFPPVCLAVVVLVYASLVYLTPSALPLHAGWMFATLFLLLILFFIGARLLRVRHYSLPL